MLLNTSFYEFMKSVDFKDAKQIAAQLGNNIWRHLNSIAIT